MIVKPNAEQLLDKASNRYELVVAISKRASQIVSGAIPRVETKEISKVTIASLELAEKQISNFYIKDISIALQSNGFDLIKKDKEVCLNYGKDNK